MSRGTDIRDQQERISDDSIMWDAVVEMIDAPIAMLLFCPACHAPHIDEPQPDKGWTNPPHRSHECQYCKCVWRPADVATTGVPFIHTQGKADTFPTDRPPEKILPTGLCEHNVPANECLQRYSRGCSGVKLSEQSTVKAE